MDDLIKCKANKIYKVNAPTIEERARIWAACGPIKARTSLVIFSIFACIGLIMIYYKGKSFKNVVVATLIAVLIGCGIYYGTIYTKKSEANKMLELYAIAKRNRPSITVYEFTKDMEIRDLKQRTSSRNRSVSFGKKGQTQNQISLPGFNFSF